MKLSIEKLVREKCKDDNRFELQTSEKVENIVSFARDYLHIFVKIEYISLQMSIRIKENSVYCLIFIDPIVVNSHNKDEIIKFINHMNSLITAFGHFYVDTYDDIAYAIHIPEYMIINHIEEVGKEMLEVPINFYTDMQIPISKLANGDWNAEIAIKFIDEMYKNGFVCNDEYGL